MMDLNEKIETAFLSALEKLGIRPGQTPPAEETQTDAARLAALEATNAELRQRAETAEAEALAARNAHEEAEKSARLAARQGEIDGLKTSFKITPATGDELAKLAADHPEAFDLALPVFQSMEPLPQLAGGTSGADVRTALEGGGGRDADADTLHNLALARMKETKETYAVAFQIVSRENPELARSLAAPRTTGVVNDAEG
jgi:multidrug efflux pump subunit AcrA (membrane-fusion protein)